MGLLAVSVFAVLYWYTLAPTVLWGDSAKLAIYVKEMTIVFDPVGNHMLHTLIGKLFSWLPFGDFAYRQNLMSAFFGILALWFFYLAMRRLLQHEAAAFLATVCLGLSHTFWLASVINESYSLCIFFFTTGFFLLLTWEEKRKDVYLILHFFLMGVALLNNLLSGLMIIATFFYLLLLERGRRWLLSDRGLLGIVCFLLGCSPMLILAFRNAPLDLGANRWFLRPGDLLSELSLYPAYLFYQFPFVGFGLGLLGTRKMVRERGKFFWVLLTVFFLNILLACGYMRQRNFFLMLPTYVLFAVWIGFGLRGAMASKGASHPSFALGALALLVILPVGLYLSLPHFSKRYQIDFVRGRQLAFRDNNRFYLNPVKRSEFGPRQYGLASLEVVKPGSLIIGDFTPMMVLLYYQEIEGLRPDVSIDATIDRYVFFPEKREELYRLIERETGRRPVYLADNEENYYSIRELEKRFTLIPQGPLWEVRRHDS